MVKKASSPKIVTNLRFPTENPCNQRYTEIIDQTLLKILPKKSLNLIVKRKEKEIPSAASRNQRFY